MKLATAEVEVERPEASVLPVDPLRLIDFATVCRRTGLSKSYIEKMLAEDEQARRPGRQFPAPLKRPNPNGGRQRVYWRELRIVEWIESMEVKEHRKEP